MDGEGRSTPRLIADAFGLYRRYPLLFLALAAVVIVPYQVLVLALTGSDVPSGNSPSVAVEIALSLFDFVVVGPLVSALHVHAVADVRQGENPHLGPIARRGLAALPVVAAAAVMSFLGIVAGALLLIVPGVILFVRWLVVAQAAAIERDGWNAALRRSWALTEGSSIHVAAFLISIGLIATAPNLFLNYALNDDHASVGWVLADTALSVVVVSFTALATALLYYDLRARRGVLAANWSEAGEQAPPATAPPADHSLDPRRYSDEERPNGWYVEPHSPHRMRYWIGGEQPGWRGKARTPGKVQEQFDEEEAASIAVRRL